MKNSIQNFKQVSSVKTLKKDTQQKITGGQRLFQICDTGGGI